MIRQLFIILFALGLLVGCSDDKDWQLEADLLDVCEIFDQHPSWFDSLVSVERKWGISAGFLLATVYQESRFYADAKPENSDVFGFAQARKGTWEDFVADTGFVAGGRDNFHAAANFVAWYTTKSITELNIKPTNYKSLYLAYHEGRAGYQKKTFLDEDKAWLLQVSGQVDMLSRHYERDFQGCSVF